MQKAIEYACTVESWDDLVDPRTLAFYCLGPEPSAFMLRTLSIEGKKRCESHSGRVEHKILGG